MENEISPSIERYREMERILQEQHNVTLKNGEGIEQKGWNILTFGSSMFAVVAVLQAILLQDKEVTVEIGVVFFFVLAFYLGMVVTALLALNPKVYTYSPGIPSKDPSNEISYEDWYWSYVGTDELSFLQQRVSDFTGDGKTSGVIEDAETENQAKAKYLRFAGGFLSATMASLVILAAVIVAA